MPAHALGKKQLEFEAVEGRGWDGLKTTGQSHKAGPSSLSVALTLPNLSRNSQV